MCRRQVQRHTLVEPEHVRCQHVAAVQDDVERQDRGAPSARGLRPDVERDEDARAHELVQVARLVHDDDPVDEFGTAWIVAGEVLIGGKPLNGGGHGHKDTLACLP